jgi:1,2-phenylacetyl-CoA epoxidase PaaB subunit
MYGFCLEKGMGYGVSGSMGYGFKSPAYQLGGSKNVWVTREYGLSGLWVIRESTVLAAGETATEQVQLA